jgi:CheY-like chemotaxis protein
VIVAEFLQDAGFKVVEAWDGEEAIRLLEAGGRFEALHTDVRMPGRVDGIDLVHEARRRYPACPCWSFQATSLTYPHAWEDSPRRSSSSASPTNSGTSPMKGIVDFRLESDPSRSKSASGRFP